jgi:hypothetical protein
MLVVVLPSPAGVGVMALTRISFPAGCFMIRLIAPRDIFAL